MISLPTVISLIFNTTTLLLNIGVLLLAVWQKPGDAEGRALAQFLVSNILLVTTITSRQLSVAYNAGEQVFLSLNNFAYAAYALSSLAAFALVITAAGEMRKAFQAIARTGMVLWLLFLIPLWRGGLFTIIEPTTLGTRVAIIHPAALFVTLTLLVYQGLTLWAAYRYRKQIANRLLILGLVIFQGTNMLAILYTPFRELGIVTWVAPVPVALIGYSLFRQNLVSPLIGRNAQVRILRDQALVLASRHKAGEVAARVARQAQVLLKTDIVALFLLDATHTKLDVVATVGSAVQTWGQVALGQGIAGRVVQTGSPFQIADYTAWEGRADGPFHSRHIYAAMGVPLIHNGEVIGALKVADHHVRRAYGEEDQALLEVLATQAATAIVNARRFVADDG